MRELNPETIDQFRERFGQLHDAVIHAIHLELFSQTEPDRAIIVLGAQDKNANPAWSWVNLTLIIDEVTNFHLKKSEDYTFSIVFEMITGIFDEKVHINLFPMGEPDRIESFQYDSCGKGCVGIVIGKKCAWQVTPYEGRK
jgi:hypothetical protein